MDDNQNGRRSISLSKETDSDRPKVREAYPVYSSNTNQESLEKQEYRNVPVQPAYQQPAQNSYDDPLPAQNRYAVPEREVQKSNNNDDLGQYYNYETPEREMPAQNIPQAAPQVTQPPAYQQNAVEQSMKFCKFCGQKIPADAVVCTHCGRQVEVLNGAVNVNRMNGYPASQMSGGQQLMEPVSDRSKSTSIVLSSLGFFGLAGIHRFYAGKPLSGILYLITGGLCFMGTLVDIIMIANGSFRDGNGRLIKK